MDTPILIAMQSIKDPKNTTPPKENSDWWIAAIQKGIEAADRGDFASDQAVGDCFAQWDINYTVTRHCEPQVKQSTN